MKMMTIPQIAQTGLLPEYTLRQMVAQGRIPVVQCGRYRRINLDILMAMLDDPSSTIYQPVGKEAS